MNDKSDPLAEKKRYDLLDPDVRLMLQVRDDVAGAYEQLVERYRDRLMRFLQHVVPLEIAAYSCGGVSVTRRQLASSRSARRSSSHICCSISGVMCRARFTPRVSPSVYPRR